ncbi:hypothetical protein HYZ78_03600 [Candidatus Microgenomates bacterium]|nr:hypothetical protein [Candidatus Microgenomates bacterium]
MNYYQITFNNLEGFNAGQIHSVITTQPGLADWWHYLPNSYIVETPVTIKFMADKIITAFPGLNFIITKIDISDFNGYLDKRAWEWLNKKTHLKGIKYVPHANSPLLDLLSGHRPPAPADAEPLLDMLDRITGKKK